jgi:hypothetical protein
LASLEDYLAHNVPARIYPAGQVPAYSNYGTTLAGYIVEQVSGEPYEQYVEEHILQPLGMDHSIMRQPVPAQLASELAQDYWFDGQYKPYPFCLVQIGPAGGLSASGLDMARFMLAHLQDGQYNGGRILKPETARQMHAQSYTFDPALPGVAHGFLESTLNGRRLIGHGGDLHGWRSMLQLIPEEQAGMFVSYNTEDVGRAREDLLQAFMDRYFPGTPVSTPPPAAGFASRVRRYTGDYIRSDFVYARSYARAFAGICQVRPGPDNTLLIDSPAGLGTDAWVEVQPLVLQNTRTGNMAVFREDALGQVRDLAVGNVPYVVLVKVPWYGGMVAKAGVMGLSLRIFLSAVVAAPVARFIRRRKREAAGRAPWTARLARWVALALCVVGIVFVAALPATEMTQLDTTLALEVLPWFVVVLAPAVVLLAAAAWWKRWWGLAGRVHYTLVALAALALLWFEAYWGFLAI